MYCIKNSVLWFSNSYLDIKILFCHLLTPFIPSVDTVEAALKLEPEEFKAKYGVTKPPQDSSDLVFYCQMGMRAGMATNKAHHLGYKK